jgi:hypothetical protein
VQEEQAPPVPEPEPVPEEQEIEEEAPEAQPTRVILRRSTDIAKEQTRRVRRPRFQYVRDERLESLEQEDTDDKSRRKKRRRLVVDEETGKLVSRPRHKHDDDETWED